MNNAAKSLDEHTRQALNAAPDADAIEFEGRWYVWGQLRSVAEDVERLLEQAGVAVLAPVAFAPRNRPVAIAAELGLIAARRSLRMIYAFQSPAGLARDVSRTSAAAVVAMEEDFTPELLDAVRSQGMAAIALSDMNARLIEGAERSTATVDNMPREPEISVYTSGTTGPPKHVGFSFDTIARYIVGQNLMNLAGASALPPVPLFYPLGNISGIYSVLPPMLHRMRVILYDRFSIDAWIDYVERFKPMTPGLPPAGIRMVLDRDLPKEKLGHAKALMSGAAPLDPTVQRAFEEKYGIPILLSYGATEFGGPVAAMMLEHRQEFGASKIGSVGRPFAGAQLRVVDPETGVEVPSGTDGLLEVIAPRMGSHWIRTTDIGMLDADGFLYLRGRADGAIIRGGFKLLPETIERALCQHEAVAAAIVVGLPDDRLGQVPGAVVKLKPNTPSDATELEAHLRQHVYATHIPTKWVFVDTLPLNTSQKPDLVKARQLLEGQ